MPESSFDDELAECLNMDFVDEDCMADPFFPRSAADWFGSIQDHVAKLPFGSLDPKGPEPIIVPVGWNAEEKKSCGLSPILESWTGFGEELNFPDMASEIKEIDFEKNWGKPKKEKIKERDKLQASSSSLRSSSAPAPSSVKTKKAAVNKIKQEEKKKRGRPRVNVGKENLPQVIQQVSYYDLTHFNPSAHALLEKPGDPDNHEDDDLVTVGTYTKATRRSKIERFKAKKLRLLLYGPYVRYAYRKQFAEARPRVGGRFIKMDQIPPLEGMPPETAYVKPEQTQEAWVEGLLVDSEPLFRTDTPELPAYVPVFG